MDLSYQDSQLVCRCIMPWKTSIQEERQMTCKEASLFYNKCRPHVHHGSYLSQKILKTNYTTTSKLSLRRPNFGEDQIPGNQINSERKQKNPNLEEIIYESTYRQKGYFPHQAFKLEMTPAWRKVESGYCSSRISSLLNTPRISLLKSPEKSKSRQPNHINYPTHTNLLNKFSNKPQQESIGSLPDAASVIEYRNPLHFHEINKPSLSKKLQYKNSIETRHDNARTQQGKDASETTRSQNQTRFIKSGPQKSFMARSNLISFSNYSELESEHPFNPKRCFSRENSYRPLFNLAARKVSSIFDEKENDVEYSVVIPGATLIRELSQERETESPKVVRKFKRSIAQGFGGMIILKQIEF